MDGISGNLVQSTNEKHDGYVEYEIDKSNRINKSSENTRTTQEQHKHRANFSTISIRLFDLTIGEIYLEGLTLNLTSKQIKWIKAIE